MTARRPATRKKVFIPAVPRRPEDDAALRKWALYDPLEVHGEDVFRAHLQTALHAITPRVYLGGIHSVLDPKHVRELGITHVVNCLGPDAAVSGARTGLAVTTLTLDIEDQDDQALDIPHVIGFMTRALEEEPKNKVLVHCAMGVSRSASFVIAFLMTERRWRVEEALMHVRSIRVQASPNEGFLRQLQQYEREILPDKDGKGGGCAIM